MKLLFFPGLPTSMDETVSNHLHELLKNNTCIVFYAMDLEPDYLMYKLCCKEITNGIKKIIKEEPIPKNQVLVLAPNSIVIELGDLCTKPGIMVDNISSKCASPGNYYYDFIPTVMNYYKQLGIEIEDISIVLEEKKETDNSELYDFEIEAYNKKMQELETYSKANHIRCTQKNQYFSKWIYGSSERSSSQLLLEPDVIWKPFFQSNSFLGNFSILITDRDDTILMKGNGTIEESYQNFELMKSFLEKGNFIFIVTSGNHEKRLFNESEESSKLWQLLFQYKNQVIGFPALYSGITLGGIKIPIGNAGVFKKDMVKSIVQIFLDRGYKINQIFCVGDSILDLDMIVETAHQFGGIGYHVRKNEDCLLEYRDLDHFTEEDWEYVRNHGIASFSDFMNQIVFPNMNAIGSNDKVKIR